MPQKEGSPADGLYACWPRAMQVNRGRPFERFGSNALKVNGKIFASLTGSVTSEASGGARRLVD